MHIPRPILLAFLALTPSITTVNSMAMFEEFSPEFLSPRALMVSPPPVPHLRPFVPSAKDSIPIGLSPIPNPFLNLEPKSQLLRQSSPISHVVVIPPFTLGGGASELGSSPISIPSSTSTGNGSVYWLTESRGGPGTWSVPTITSTFRQPGGFTSRSSGSSKSSQSSRSRPGTFSVPTTTSTWGELFLKGGGRGGRRGGWPFPSTIPVPTVTSTFGQPGGFTSRSSGSSSSSRLSKSRPGTFSVPTTTSTWGESNFSGGDGSGPGTSPVPTIISTCGQHISTCESGSGSGTITGPTIITRGRSFFALGEGGETTSAIPIPIPSPTKTRERGQSIFTLGGGGATTRLIRSTTSTSSTTSTTRTTYWGQSTIRFPFNAILEQPAESILSARIAESELPIPTANSAFIKSTKTMPTSTSRNSNALPPPPTLKPDSLSAPTRLLVKA